MTQTIYEEVYYAAGNFRVAIPMSTGFSDPPTDSELAASLNAGNPSAEKEWDGEPEPVQNGILKVTKKFYEPSYQVNMSTSLEIGDVSAFQISDISVHTSTNTVHFYITGGKYRRVISRNFSGIPVSNITETIINPDPLPSWP